MKLDRTPVDCPPRWSTPAAWSAPPVHSLVPGRTDFAWPMRPEKSNGVSRQNDDVPASKSQLIELICEYLTKTLNNNPNISLRNHFRAAFGLTYDGNQVGPEFRVVANHLCRGTKRITSGSITAAILIAICSSRNAFDVYGTFDKAQLLEALVPHLFLDDPPYAPDIAPRGILPPRPRDPADLVRYRTECEISRRPFIADDLKVLRDEISEYTCGGFFCLRTWSLVKYHLDGQKRFVQVTTPNGKPLEMPLHAAFRPERLFTGAGHDDFIAAVNRDELDGTRFINAQLPKLELPRGINLEGVHLVKCNLEHSRLCGVSLAKAVASGSNFRGANLKKADLRSTCMPYADFRKTDLRGAKFDGANTAFADFRHSNLSGVTGLQVASGADFRNAITTDAILHINLPNNMQAFFEIVDNGEEGNLLTAIDSIDDSKLKVELMVDLIYQLQAISRSNSVPFPGQYAPSLIKILLDNPLYFQSSLRKFIECELMQVELLEAQRIPPHWSPPRPESLVSRLAYALSKLEERNGDEWACQNSGFVCSLLYHAFKPASKLSKDAAALARQAWGMYIARIPSSAYKLIEDNVGFDRELGVPFVLLSADGNEALAVNMEYFGTNIMRERDHPVVALENAYFASVSNGNKNHVFSPATPSKLAEISPFVRYFVELCNIGEPPVFTLLQLPERYRTALVRAAMETTFREDLTGAEDQLQLTIAFSPHLQRSQSRRIQESRITSTHWEDLQKAYGSLLPDRNSHEGRASRAMLALRLSTLFTCLSSTLKLGSSTDSVIVMREMAIALLTLANECDPDILPRTVKNTFIQNLASNTCTAILSTEMQLYADERAKASLEASQSLHQVYPPALRITYGPPPRRHWLRT